MGAPQLRADASYRKRILLAVAAMLLVFITLTPFIASAATPTPNQNITPGPAPEIRPAEPANPTSSPTTPTPTPVVTEITIKKASSTVWWVIYPPDGKQVLFESVAEARLIPGTDASDFTDFERLTFEVYDNQNNKLPISFDEALPYMRSKGLWESAERDRSERTFWQKVTGFLSDIWNGIVNIGRGVSFLAEALLTGQFVSLLVAAIVALIGDGVSQLTVSIIDTADATEVLFETPIARILVGFAENFGFMLWIIGFIIATAEIVINHRSNKLIGDSIQDYIMNIFKSGLAVIFFTQLPLPLYLLTTDLATKICRPILNSGAAGSFNLNNLNFDFAPSDIMLLIFFIALLFTGLKVLFSFIKRGGILMILILVGSLHLISTPRGYWDSFWGWSKQVLALCITQFCQMALFCSGISIFLSSFMVSFATFMAGLSLTLAAAEVPRIAERFGMDTSLKGNASGAIQTIATVARMAVLKH